MATEEITVVDPDQGAGWDYASLSAWEADFGNTTGDLPSDDKIAVAKCRCTGGTADSTAVVISGWTTDSTRYIKVWTDPAEGYRHSGKWETGNKYRLDISAAYSIGLTLYANHLQFIGLLLRCSGSGSYGVNNQATPTRLFIDSCVFTSTDYAANTGSSNLEIRNSVFYGGAQAALKISYSTGGIYNCTITKGGYGIEESGSVSVEVKNTYSGGNSTSDYNGTMTFTTCASSDATEREGVTPSIAHTTDNFTNVTNGSEDYHLVSGASSTLKTGGTDLSGSFTTDIDGDTRSDWGIGADEYVVAATTVAPTTTAPTTLAPTTISTTLAPTTVAPTTTAPTTLPPTTLAPTTLVPTTLAPVYSGRGIGRGIIRGVYR